MTDEESEGNEFEHLLDDSIGTTSGRTSKFDIDDVRRTATMVDESKTVQHIVAWRREDRGNNHAGGRVPLVDDRTVLVVLLLLGREHAPQSAREMGNLLHQRLTTEARTYLGLPVTLSGSQKGRIEARRWYNAAWNSFHRLIATMDPYPDTQHYRLQSRADRERVLRLRDHSLVDQRRKRLNWYSDAFLEMTFRLQPRDVRRHVKQRVTIGIDQTTIAATSPRGRAPIDPKTGMERRFNPKTKKEYKDKLVIETDAGWNAKSPEKRDGSGPENRNDTEYVWGWAGNVAVLVPNTRSTESEFANIAIGYSMSMPGHHLARDTVAVAQSIIDRGYTPGTIVADREYFANLLPETLHVPIKKMGFDVITDYQVTRMGVRGGKAGAIQVEGRHYCAGTGKDLLNASNDAAAHRIDEETYRTRLEERTAFELRRKELPDDRGHVPMMCPAAGPNPAVTCPIRKIHPKAPDKVRPSVQDKNVPEAPDLICTQGTVDFGPTDGIRDAQLFRYQSKEWSDAYRVGRNTDESFHAYVKSKGHEALDVPARRRIRGFAAQQVLTTILLVSANIRKIIKFLTDRATRAAQGKPTASTGMGPVRATTRRRDREGHSNYKAKWPLKVLPGAPDGSELDPPLRT
ncbi:hypothetical protein [Cryobacterium sp. TMT4-31]|uniref:hypothetical protein n=1 Tax=Cryobacterium sp. TMT4-31 TaxID=1259259 RepID=UPI00106C48D0|nr:hypothetical protein [Cryobacterium sp. TMT4-31]TFC92864.1 hypothetical protein E3T19_00790 [Cryobacterium sp. TMT4-31]